MAAPAVLLVATGGLRDDALAEARAAIAAAHPGARIELEMADRLADGALRWRTVPACRDWVVGPDKHCFP